MLDVARWLAEQGLEQYAEAFAENAIDGEVLRTLSGDDLKELGVKRSATEESSLLQSPCSAKSQGLLERPRAKDELSTAPVRRSDAS
jgi:hypothetical protein